jgi:hypothetical protein
MVDPPLWGMDLTRDTARHDNVNSNRHARDKEQKAARDRVKFEPVAAVEMTAAGRYQDGVSAKPRTGFCFRVVGGQASVMDGRPYVRAALKRSKELARVKILRDRNGKQVTDYLNRKHGIESIVGTVPPWAAPTISKMGKSEREVFALAIAEKVHKVAVDHGRPLYGGGWHEDTDVQHWHFHMEKVGPKAQACRAAPWSVGADRIRRKFPDLLSPEKVEMLEDNLSKKRIEDLIDLKIARIIDEETERYIKDTGRWAQYEKDCEAYAKDKAKKQKVEKQAPIVQAGLAHFALAGVWPLAYGIMTLAMWRMVPAELRKPVMISIRAFQVLRKPSAVGAISLATMALAKGPKAQDMPDHLRSIGSFNTVNARA